MYAGYRRWPPSSAVCWQSNVLGQEITQPVLWPLFCHRRANAVEQSTWTASAAGHHLRTIQTIAGNVYVWLVGPRRPVSERQGRWLEIFLLTYLPAFHSWNGRQAVQIYKQVINNGWWRIVAECRQHDWQMDMLTRLARIITATHRDQGPDFQKILWRTYEKRMKKSDLRKN